MPYFERRPWQETTESLERPVADAQGSTYDFVEAARGILDRETARKSAHQGPFRCRTPVKPGGEGRIRLAVTLEETTDRAELAFSCDGLAGPSGTRLAAHAVEIDPPTVKIAPGQQGTLTVSIRVPERALAGLYHGRIVGAGTSPVTFDIELEVRPAG